VNSEKKFEKINGNKEIKGKKKISGVVSINNGPPQMPTVLCRIIGVD